MLTPHAKVTDGAPVAKLLDGRVIANYVLDYADNKGRQISNLALQKILYFCHVWTLIELNQPLIRQEFEAWEFGPVLQYVYREFKQAENEPIRTRAKRLEPSTGKLVEAKCLLSEDIKGLLDRVLEFYTQLSASQLVKLSHVENGPWHMVWNHKGKINPGMRISNEEIARFYANGFTQLGCH